MLSCWNAISTSRLKFPCFQSTAFAKTLFSNLSWRSAFCFRKSSGVKLREKSLISIRYLQVTCELLLSLCLFTWAFQLVAHLKKLNSLKFITELPLAVIEHLVSSSIMTAPSLCWYVRYSTVLILRQSVKTPDLCSTQPNCQVSCSEISVLVRSGE